MAKSHAVLLKAQPFNSREELRAACLPFHFRQLGNESAEKQQIKKELGWKQVVEAGKFYDGKGSFTWYWYVYGQGSSSGLPLNPAASQACGKKIYGDVMLLKSGPAHIQYDTDMTIDEVLDSVLFYSDPRNKPNDVFAQRERQRVFGNLGANVKSFHMQL